MRTEKKHIGRKKMVVNIPNVIPNHFSCCSYLIKCIIQTLIEIFKIEQNYSPSNFHVNLDLVDVSTHLHGFQNKQSVYDIYPHDVDIIIAELVSKMQVYFQKRR